MKALRSFTVRARLPEALSPLVTLALNLRWSWDQETRDLFRWVDPELWEATRRDPVALIAAVEPERLHALTDDPGFMRFLSDTADELSRYLTNDRWFQLKGPSPLQLVGYFSPEFGISEALPQYSGGLGVLAGDHLKASSDLGVPLVGVGLFYRHGYFRQSLSHDGWQQERYPDLDPYAMAVTLVDGARVTVDLAGRALHAQVWRADVGRTPLYLLDSDIDDNDPDMREVTDRLYGGDVEHRLQQEILLGMGGVRMLEAVGLDAQVFHTNEGHAGFLGLERMHRLITKDGLTFTEAVEAVRASSLFTTHTPVPAGIDRFPKALMEKYFGTWATDCHVSLDALLALGRRDDEPNDERFNMAVMGLRLAARSNAVAKLHGDVSRHMFSGLWPDVPVAETPIASITNGVHAPTWTAPEFSDVFSRYVSPNWTEASPSEWERIVDVSDDELWRAREHRRGRLATHVRARLRATGIGRGLSPSEVEWCDNVLDPKVLTIGFARRFATYKRATLLLSQPERLRRLLLAPDPVQFVFAGKAHPADDLGKALIRDLIHFAGDPSVRHRFVFVDDYDIALARYMYQGCDVWLNNPRRPQEACGTSGMKAAMNGALNCSILDGWWDESFDGTNGWAITSAEGEADLARRDEIEANSLFELLEHQIVPLYYQRTEGPTPRAWVRRMKASLATLCPQVTAARMVRDYVTDLYEPTAAHAARINADNHAAAKALVAWKTRVSAGWSGVTVVDVETDNSAADLGAVRSVEATVGLGDLEPEDVSVQLLHGPVGQGDEIVDPQVVQMTLVSSSDSKARYRGELSCAAAGRYGFTVRVLPANPDLAQPVEMGLIVWA
ncbi:MAG TPA: alpha-glucan family phosphorylase [Acidimicrobiales bacterium]|nr:alpha-glucan family phosphorylase [Acidimicrobiales bacterium]